MNANAMLNGLTAAAEVGILCLKNRLEIGAV